MKIFIFYVTMLLASTAVKAQEVTSAIPADNKPDTAKIFVAVEKDPSFQGGMQNFYSYLSQNLQYPAFAVKNRTEGKVYLTFIVEKDGSLSNVKAVRGISQEIDAEAIRVLQNSPKWTPGIQNRRAVRVQYTVPINFKLPPAAANTALNDTMPDDHSKIFTAVEQHPQFVGGVVSFYKYLGDNIHYPEKSRSRNIQGIVFLTFVVEKDGSLSDIKVVKSVADDIDAEALRVMKICPNWNPGMQNGRAVRVQYTVTVNFVLLAQTTAKDTVTFDQDKVFTAVEQDPSWPGGVQAFRQYFAENLNYPEKAKKDGLHGHVIVYFIVERDGSLSHIKVQKSLSPETDAEALRVINNCPKWIPGMQNGKPARVVFTLAVPFPLPSH